MPFDANTDGDQIASLSIKLQTLQAQTDRITQKCADLREMVCAREHSNGTLTLNFDALAERLGPVACLELRAAIDARWNISGEAGQKPRMRVAGEAAA